MANCKVLKLNIAVASTNKVISAICRQLPQLKGRYITFVNVHALTEAMEDEAYYEAQAAALSRLPDGFPVMMVERLKGYRKAKRVAGPDFFEKMLAESERQGYRNYFYGGTKEVATHLEVQLKKKYPDLVIAGIYSPGELKNGEVLDEDIKRINDAKPDLIWVGLGAPKQEMWMYHAKDRVDGLMFGVGAAFDFFAGTKKRAPKILQRMGLEWLFRMLQEPKRLGYRYISSNSGFIYYMIKEFLNGKN